jgi:hypothetical protein
VLSRSAVVTAAVTAALTLGVAVSGCSGKKQPSGGGEPTAVAGTEVARFIEQQLAGRFPGLTVGVASCPASLKLAPEKPEFCKVAVEGQPVRVKVTRADNGQYTVANDQAVIPVASLEDKLRANASQQAGVPLLVDCGDRAVLVFDPPKTVQCVGSAPGRAPVTYDVTINDAQGGFSYAPHKEPGG